MDIKVTFFSFLNLEDMVRGGGWRVMGTPAAPLSCGGRIYPLTVVSLSYFYSESSAKPIINNSGPPPPSSPSPSLLVVTVAVATVLQNQVCTSKNVQSAKAYFGFPILIIERCTYIFTERIMGRNLVLSALRKFNCAVKPLIFFCRSTLF